MSRSLANGVEPDMRMQRMRALLVDDELLARVALRQALVSHADVEIVGECGTGREAVIAIGTLHPDVVFLDIEMPQANGFSVVDALPPDERPIIVFVTAFSAHALRAFDAHALGYVLKPLDQTRFDGTLEGVRTHWLGRRSRVAATPTPPAIPTPPAGFVERLSVRAGERLQVLRVADIDWFSAEGNYVGVHAAGATYLHRDTLTRLETALDPARFLRIHRGTIVNLERVTEVHPLFYGDCELRLKDGSRLTLSRRFRARARRALGLP